jgi:predicted 2-oxoglutarate/Fe(II)-dependent dioxygenase YbiX
MHIKYSGIVYLNTMTNGGELHFEASNYSYKPEAGDLVLFPSHEGGRHGVNRIDEVRYSFLMWMTDLDHLALS